MTLQAVRLDDLTWRDMVDAIRGRIAAASDEEWTLHAPVDPGVTLIELFAYLLEQRLYWMDQVPDALIHGLIALLGAERRPAIAARTLLEFAQNAPGQVAAGTVLEIRNGDSLVRLATDEDAALLRVERLEVTGPFGTTSARIESTPRWAMQPLTLLPADGSAAEATVTLWLRQAPDPAQAGRPLPLFLELDTPARIAASWSTEAVEDVPVPATLTWWYGDAGPQQRRQFAASEVDDRTQGLRRSGTVRLAIPAAWAPAGPAANGLTPYRLWVRCESASFAAPPRLLRLIPNTVAAAHSVDVPVIAADLDAQFDRWMPLPGMTLALGDPSPPLEDSVRLKLFGRDRVWRDWTPTWDFSRHGPADAVMLVDRVFNCLRFPDGLTGRLPVLDRKAAVRAELAYRAGGGEAGNLGSGLEWTATALDATAINPVPVRGGRETETAGEARDRVAAMLIEVERAVTAKDHEDLAVGAPGVAVQRAKAIAGFHPAFPCVTVPGAISVFIVPEVPRATGWLTSDRAVKAPQPDPGMLTHVRARLEERRLVATELFVLRPVYRAVDVVATVAAGPLDRTALADQMRSGLVLYLDALVGGNDGKGWPFGQPVRPSELAHQLQLLAGSDAVVERVAARLVDPAAPDAAYEDCVDIVIAAHELVVLNSLTVKWTSRGDRHGGLR